MGMRLTRSRFPPSYADMTSKARTSLVVFFILAFPFAVFFAFLLSDLAGPLPPIRPLPNPNGYDIFLHAAQLLTVSSIDYTATNQEQLREAVGKNAPALALARAGLSNECQVPIQFSQASMENHLQNLAALKRLAQSFMVEGQLAKIENHPGDAAKSYLDTVHLGIESARGGCMIDELVGVAIEQYGMDGLRKIAGRLEATSCREIAAALETLDAQSQTWDEVLQQEHDWSRRTFPGLQNELARMMERRNLKQAFQKAGQKFKLHQTRMRQLMIDLAARAYELDKGKAPANVSDLAPEYLKAIPQDPVIGTNMVYSPR